MLVKLNSFSLLGLKAKTVKIEIDIRGGLPGFDIIGLPDVMVKESKERVLSSIKNSGFKVPLQRIIINLAPADIKKQGTFFDLPIALGILIASKQLSIFNDFDDTIFAGELSLDGSLSFLKGALCITINAKENNFKKVILPLQNYNEANIVQGVNVLGIKNLREAIEILQNGNISDNGKKTIDIKEIIKNLNKNDKDTNNGINFKDVKGQYAAKRAIEIAVSGSHNILMSGPPGSGKSMIAKRVPTIIPMMTMEEMIETTMIHSIAGELDENFSLIHKRPFRSPHHTSSSSSIVGGGKIPRPGEVTLAHNGILFLDEFPHFNKNILYALREPLEDSVITISRVSGTATFPSNFMLIGSMNPCPCGYYGHPDIECKCSQTQIKQYLSKLSGPLLDRIDIYINVPKIEYSRLLDYNSKEEDSERIAKRVENVRKIQIERFKRSATNSNASMLKSEINKYCQLNSQSKRLISIASEKLRLSGRGFDRILKISRTIADMDNCENIEENHIMEALQYRKPLFNI